MIFPWTGGGWGNGFGFTFIVQLISIIIINTVCRYSATVDCESLERLVKERKDDGKGKAEKTN